MIIFIESVGRALVRFERSTHPDHKGTRTVVLRFLKIITPIRCVVPDYDGKLVLPKEGELYQRYPKYPRNAAVNLWSLNIDKSVMGRDFKLLWDT